MKHALASLLFLIATPVLAADSPYSCVSGIYSAASRGDLAGLRGVLVGRALEKYGTEDAMSALASEARSFPASRLETTLLRSRKDRDGQDAFRLYRVDVVARPFDRASVLRSIEVGCRVRWRLAERCVIRAHDRVCETRLRAFESCAASKLDL
jgi:hypothetical protein